MVDHVRFERMRAQAATDRDDAIWQAKFDFDLEIRRIDAEEEQAKRTEAAEEVRQAKAVWYGERDYDEHR